MTITLSEHPAYLEYGTYLGKGDYKAAANALILCIDDVRRDGDLMQHAELLQALADVMFYQGDVARAIELHQDAEKLDKNAPLTKYNFAKFLERKLKDHRKAISKCDEVIDMVSHEHLIDEDDTLGKDHYLASSYALKGYCYHILGDFVHARENLLLMSKIESELVIDYSIKLCEVSLLRGDSVPVAKKYLSDLLARAGDSWDGRYREFRDHIRKLIESA